MKCPNCGEDAAGINQTITHDTCVLRRRVCRNCGHRFLTEEVAVPTPVVPRSNPKQPVIPNDRKSA